MSNKEWDIKSYNESVLFEEAYEKGKLENTQVFNAILEIPELECEPDHGCEGNCSGCEGKH